MARRRKTTEKEKKDFRNFMEELEGKDFFVEVASGRDGESIKQNCGKGIYDKIKNDLLQFGHRRYRLVFEKNGKACGLSEVKPGWVVINLASPAGCVELLPNIIKLACAEEGVLL